MKRTIRGLRFDTEKATLIAETDNIGPQISRRDYSFWEAGLYITPRAGRFFLAGRGGPRSIFAEKVGQAAWTGGDGIIPFEDAAAAYTWAQQELQHRTDWDEIEEKYFSEMAQDA